jgi:hypothetical protein
MGCCLCHWRGCRRPHVPLLDANNGDEVIQLSPTLLFCYVWLVLMMIRRVFLPNTRSRLGKSKNPVRNIGMQILWNGASVDVCTYLQFAQVPHHKRSTSWIWHVLTLVCSSCIDHKLRLCVPHQCTLEDSSSYDVRSSWEIMQLLVQEPAVVPLLLPTNLPKSWSSSAHGALAELPESLAHLVMFSSACLLGPPSDTLLALVVRHDKVCGVRVRLLYRERVRAGWVCCGSIESTLERYPVVP